MDTQRVRLGPTLYVWVKLGLPGHVYLEKSCFRDFKFVEDDKVGMDISRLVGKKKK